MLFFLLNMNAAIFCISILILFISIIKMTHVCDSEKKPDNICDITGYLVLLSFLDLQGNCYNSLCILLFFIMPGYDKRGLETVIMSHYLIQKKQNLHNLQQSESLYKDSNWMNILHFFFTLSLFLFVEIINIVCFLSNSVLSLKTYLQILSSPRNFSKNLANQIIHVLNL